MPNYRSSRLSLLIALLALLSATACDPHRAVTDPLKYLPPDCHCRYVAMARHYYDCKLAYLLEVHDLTRPVARDSAVVLTHAFIAEVQLNISERDRKKMCNCLELRRRYGPAAYR